MQGRSSLLSLRISTDPMCARYVTKLNLVCLAHAEGSWCDPVLHLIIITRYVKKTKKIVCLKPVTYSLISNPNTRPAQYQATVPIAEVIFFCETFEVSCGRNEK